MDKPLMMMTGSELVELAREITKTIKETERSADVELVMGWSGLAKLFGVSVNTAKARHRTGALDGATYEVDGKIVTNAKKALSQWAEYISKR